MDEEKANWDAMWRSQDVDLKKLLAEERTPRWKQIESYVLARWGTFEGLRVIEIGSGHGTNAIHFARRGARASVLDNSEAALEGARRAAKAVGATVQPILGDVFDLTDDIRGAFDLSCSFGLCEHFLGDRRQRVVAAHLDLLAPGGAAAIGVPNRWSFPYRAWMGFLKTRRHWPLGTEVPFDARELTQKLRKAGGAIDHVGYGSFSASLVNYLANPVLHNAGRKGVPLPQFRTPLDRFAYELLVIARRVPRPR